MDHPSIARHPVPCLCGAFLLMLGLAATVSAGVAETPKPAELLLYVGTYTSEKSQGIYMFRMNMETGELTPAGVVTGITNPSFLAIHPTRKYLYAVSEVSDSDGRRTGGVTAFAIDPETGKLTELNSQPSEGAEPRHLVVDRSGKTVLVANYGGGSVAALPIGEDGRLGKATAAIQHTGSSVDAQRQSGPHAHSINVDLSNHFAVAADLGLDKLLIYRLDPAKGTLTANDPPSVSVKPGSGPRHFAFHPNGHFAYVINEMLCTVTAFAFDGERGTLREIQTITTLPHEVKPGYSTAEVQVHPS